MTGSRFASPAAESPGFLLWQLTLAWQRELSAVLKPLGLTHVQFVLLASSWWLGRSGTAPRQVDVAQLAGTDPKMTSEVLRKLEAKGLIDRTVDPQDTRSRRIAVTDDGASLAARSVAVVEAADEAFFSPAPQVSRSLAVILAGHRPSSTNYKPQGTEAR